MFRLPLLSVAAIAALSIAACGGSDSAGVSPQAAKTTVERAAHLKLAPEPVPADARDQGLRASYSNTRTAVKDQQVVGLFVMKNAGVADKVSDLVRGSAPKSARLIRNGAVMVVYAPAGSDRGAAVKRAVEGL
jgi:hypothetical protein